MGRFQYRYNEDQSIPVDPGDTDPPIFTPDPVKDPPAEANRFGAFAAQSVSEAAPSRPTLEFFPTAEGYYDYIGKKYV
ncbi:hypothetical protein, partial [Flavobacterium sp. UGB4466]|uniref:hypothetical protein n=1 Tax=Flavobacterium sp. UGB4466 TaxID=2730889 RepID=UPI00192B86F6